MLLIIAPAALTAPLEKLKKHKTRTGIPTTIVTLEKIYQRGYSGDEAEQVKRYIADRVATDLCRYVLLVGDADVFPVRYTKTDREDAKACNVAFFPTDLYYASLHQPNGAFDTWDSNGNGYYGELRGETGSGTINVDDVSLLPEIAVGRVPASTVDDVRRFVTKCIGYEEKAGQADWTWSAVLVGTHNWGSRDWASQTLLNLAQGPLALYSTTLVITRGQSRGDELACAAITGAVNQRVGLVGYLGHGTNSALAIPTGGWGVGEIPKLSNSEAWPIMLAAACDTGGFATLPPYNEYVDVNGVTHQGSAHGEVFTTAPPQPDCIQNWVDPDDDLATNITVRTDHGAVAYFGGVTGMQNTEPFEILLDWVAHSSTVGDAWREMIKAYYELPSVPRTLPQPSWSQLARFHQPWKYVLFGDPSLRIHGVGTQDQAITVVIASATS